MDLWRISKFHSLNGDGGRLYAGRWNTRGNPLVYLADSPAGALLEILVHLELDVDDPPPPYTLLHVTVPDTLFVATLLPPKGGAWKTNEAVTRKLGDTWLQSKENALARVPSAILPETYNYLLNPLHADAAGIKIVGHYTDVIDERLLHHPAEKTSRTLRARQGTRKYSP